MVSSAFFFHLPKIWASAGTGAASDSAAAMIKIFDSLMIDRFLFVPYSQSEHIMKCKSVGILPLPVPSPKAFALPISKERATQNPRKYESGTTRSMLIQHLHAGKFIPEWHLPLLHSWSRLEVAKFWVIKNQTSDKRFSDIIIYCIPAYPPLWVLRKS